MTSHRRAALPAAATLATACLLTPLMTPALAVQAAADEEVTFGTSEEAAPTVGPGRYTFPMPGAGTDFYLTVERTVPRSTLWVAETLVSSTNHNGYGYFDPSGADSKNRCGEESDTFEGDDYVGHRFMTGITGIGRGPCLKEDAVTFEYRAYESSDGSYPAGEKAQLAVWEEPPVEDASLLPPPSTTTTWDGAVQPAKGDAELGTSYADAPELTQGRWSVHVDPGVPALFAVPLDWGQHLELQLKYTGAEWKEYVPVEPVLLTPLGGEADWARTEGDGPTFPDANLKYPSMDGGVVSPTITWRNREKPTANPAAFAGTYYVLLRMGTKDAPAKGADVTVGVNVVTDRAADAPYAEDAPALPDISGKTSAGEGKEYSGDGGGGTEEASGPESEPTPWGAVTALFGGSAVMAAAGAFSLGRYRRGL
ncbi:hypothetical protein EKO23_18060 [Nocardioides guangzhouensis]|uniref:Peptidase n=1 Tax=Nocardioides guangzhouensis TaxID=2497878 RepID=A0A4Q4Z8N3_9ACTN|nr:hypothetical protein [Nocardioides guangzhouensis]RYP83805.1 hypothetical protein EKO23_18060 [Nocardioides guangzhouensis]